MKRSTMSLLLSALAGLFLLAVPTFASGPSSPPQGFGIAAKATGTQEVPAILTGGSAIFLAQVNEQAQTITFKLTFNNLSAAPEAASINFAQAGVNGAAVAFLCGGGTAAACPTTTSGTVTGTITATEVIGVPAQGVAAGSFQDLVRVIGAGTGYVNVTTATFSGGEVRGQIF
jgi:hypothetical protein